MLEDACLNAGGREAEVVSNPSLFLPVVALQDYYVGRLDDNKPSASLPSTSGDAPVPHQLAASNGELVTLNPREKVTLRLAERIEVSQNSRIFRFALSSPQQRLGLPCGKHVYVYAKVQKGRHDTANCPAVVKLNPLFLVIAASPFLPITSAFLFSPHHPFALRLTARA